MKYMIDIAMQFPTTGKSKSLERSYPDKDRKRLFNCCVQFF
jgi:hypothetical protein